MKLPQCVDHVDEDLIPAVTKIKHRHLTEEMKRVLKLRNSANFKQRWTKAQGVVSK